MKYFLILLIFLFLGCTFGHERDNPHDPGAGDYYKGENYDDSSSSVVGNKSSSSGGNNTSGVLKAPTGVTAVGSSSKSITISWNAVAGTSKYPVSGYYVYRSDEASGPYAEVGGTSETSFTNSNLAAYTTFYYKVVACSGYGCYYSLGSSDVLGEQSAAVSGTTFLVAPTGTKAISETSSSITISWNNLQGATAYRIFKSGNSGGTYTEIGTSTSNSYIDTGMPSKVQYYYKVSGYNSITEGDESSYVSATTLLKAPTGVTATANSSSSIIINWNAVTDANGYYVYRSDNASGPYVKIDGTSETTYTNSNLSPGTTFYYKVLACNGYGCYYSLGSSDVLGEQSTVVSTTTLD